MRTSIGKMALAALAMVVVSSLASCKKNNGGGDTFEQKTCQFCAKEFNTQEECLQHQNTCNYYDSPDIADASLDYSNWMKNLPDTTQLINLTIPGMHDAATYSWDKSVDFGVFRKWIKDQGMCYAEAWAHGVRAFDLRIGYDSRLGHGSFEERCKFFHGDIPIGVFFGYCVLRNFMIDINEFFPKENQLEGECMFLIVKNEYYAGIETFGLLQNLLIGRYGNRFIAYNDSLTLGDVRGKIILFVRNIEYTSAAHATVNHLHEFPIDNMTINTPFHCDAGKDSKIYVQDEYDVPSPLDKINRISASLRRQLYYRKEGERFLAINGFNAVQGRESWGVCNEVNGHILRELKGGDLNDEFRQPLGIVLCDWMGIDEWEGYHFEGLQLLEALVDHNKRWYLIPNE